MELVEEIIDSNGYEVKNSPLVGKEINYGDKSIYILNGEMYIKTFPNFQNGRVIKDQVINKNALRKDVLDKIESLLK